MQAIGHRHRKTKRWEAVVWAVLLGTAHLAEAAPDWDELRRMERAVARLPNRR